MYQPEILDTREEWSVVGAGLERRGTELVPVPGTWLVFAGGFRAEPLDGPAFLAHGEFQKQIPAKSDGGQYCRSH